ISCSTLLASFHHPTPAPICTLSLHDALPISSVWDPVAGVFGAAPMIFGTLASSLVALLLAVPLALGVAIYLTEFAPKWLRQPVALLVELLAAIPSVVYGLWGIFVLIPFLRTYVVPPLRAT